jgi:hypothetical protein
MSHVETHYGINMLPLINLHCFKISALINLLIFNIMFNFRVGFMVEHCFLELGTLFLVPCNTP